MRPSLHIEPTGTLDIARHYVRELIYDSYFSLTGNAPNTIPSRP